MNELKKEKITEMEESVTLMPEKFPSVREILEHFSFQNDAVEENASLIARDLAGNEIGCVSYDYKNSVNLTEITRGDGMKYVMAYNDGDNLESIQIEGVPDPLIVYACENKNFSITYANGDAVKIFYNPKKEIAAVIWTDCQGITTEYYQCVYDKGGRIVRKVDIIQGKAYNYFYKNDNVICVETENILMNAKEGIIVQNLENTIHYVYDSERKLITTCTQDADGNEQECCHAGVAPERQLQFSADNAIVEAISFGNGRRISYEYDDRKRVTKVTDSEEGVTVYTYDTLGQLAEENKNGVTAKFLYDSYGNLKEKRACDENGNTVELSVSTYGAAAWKDKLTAFNGVSVIYGKGGNPLSYRGHTFIWEKGQQLKFAVKSGNVISYRYDDRGIRTDKNVNGVNHTYLLCGRQIIQETCGSTKIDYLYDEDGVCGLRYQGKLYGFYKNLQGDIIAIIDENDKVVAAYSYDAWGECTITSDTSGIGIADINPFRYRGYYYDKETGFYYLQTRYYDPVVGRFLNADTPGILLDTVGDFLGVNLFAYCYNDPVNRSDPTGRWGPSIHYGKEINNSFRYGTVKWAMDCGMCREDAIIVGTADNGLDDFWTGAGTPIGGTGKHFNSNSSENLDSRLQHFRTCYRSAIQLWRGSAPGSDSRKEALKRLGKGLHSIQDYYAHLDFDYQAFWDECTIIGQGPHHSYSYDAYASCGVLQDYNKGYFDNEEYDISGPFSNGKYFHKRVGKNNSWRYNYTKRDTMDYITGFMEAVCYHCC